ncbi:TPA: hypothetical protein DCZ39_07725 [Patescibacteria group bacterium]|nr:hypothetical protein [Candidatus Gracilibacteria bacterium]
MELKMKEVWISINELNQIREYISATLICLTSSFQEAMSKQCFHDTPYIFKKYMYLLSLPDDVSVLVDEVVEAEEVI